MSAWEAGGKSDEWFTPARVFAALGEVFDTDVASPVGIRTHVPCARRLTKEEPDAEWRGFIWMNAPFGGRNGLLRWLVIFFCHDGGGIALTPDRTSAPWFRYAWRYADAVLFLPKVRFLRPDGTEGVSPSTGTALFAHGPRAVAALRRAAAMGLGILAIPENSPLPAAPADGGGA